MGEGVVLQPDDPALIELGIDGDALAELAKEVSAEMGRTIELLGSYRGVGPGPRRSRLGPSGRSALKVSAKLADFPVGKASMDPWNRS
jgi:hypothetical protein